MNNEKKNYLFLGFAIPEMEKVFNIDGFPQVQTHKFNWNLINGLEYFDECDFTYISSRPITDYPSFPKKIIKRQQWTIQIHNKKINIQELPFINCGILKIITRLISSLFYSIKNYSMISNKGGVIVYSVHVPYMLTGLIISKLYKIDFIAIWTDPPAVSTNYDSKLKSKLRNFEFKISKYLMKKVTKVIAVTKYLAEDFAPGKPYLVIEGLININDINYSAISKKSFSNDILKIVYTGSLEKKYGIKNIIDGFLLSKKNSNMVLEIYGKGDFENELHLIMKQHHNVIYKGFLPNNEILRIQREADFLINARSTEEYFVKYTFPSKTLEYMLSGTPLITTMLPGIPEDYKNFVIVLDNNKPEVIAEKLDEVMEYSIQVRNQIGLKAQKFATTKNNINQAHKILEFLKEV